MLNQFTLKFLRPKQFFRGLGAAFFSWYCFFKEFYCSSFLLQSFPVFPAALVPPDSHSHSLYPSYRCVAKSIGFH